MIEFWEFIIFLVNSIVFLLLGDQILFPYFLEHIDTSLVAIVAVASRAVAIYSFSAISGWLTRNPIPWAEQTVLWWVGLRGGVAIALALSISDLGCLTASKSSLIPLGWCCLPCWCRG
jgi:CPA1 family monovalent cation:H+ antiporter